MSVNSSNGRFTLFPKWSIVLFSVLCTYLCGALMLLYNLRQVGKMKKSWIVIVLHIIVFAVLKAGLRQFALGSILEYLIPNLVVGLLLAFPVWDNFFPEIEVFKSKNLFIPAIATLIVWGGMVLVRMFYVK